MKSLDDSCPKCGKNYDFPLSDPPTRIRDYRVVKALRRGFYAATYVAERGNLGAKSVLKVSPTAFYDFFRTKDFKQECQTHLRVAADTEHIVDIRDMFEAEVAFANTRIPCFIAELEYVEGPALAEYLDSGIELSATAAAQIAIDLFRILDELRKKNVNHNDLHASNIIIQSLGPDSRRAGAIDESIRAVAIDLGSISDVSKSDSAKLRLGDLHWIAEHLSRIVGELLHDPDKISDMENRLASALQHIVHVISPSAESQRTPSCEDFIGQIEEAHFTSAQQWRPWRESLKLKAFSASYNAQTMLPWHVPQLLVDPDEQWLNAISSPGPQVITGMRGCGKTMLLRALQFHARAARRGDESDSRILKRLDEDNYIGLFVSAQRLLERLGEETGTIQESFARLFAAFGLEAVRALNHLRDIDEGSVSKIAPKELAEAISAYINNSDDLKSAISMNDLERHIVYLLTSLSRGNHNYSFAGQPNIAFPFLADAIRRCSPIWETSSVLFLLDDVSTRYLKQHRIMELLPELLFQSPVCSFKLTSEAQTIELGLKSPGGIHLARIGRDLSVFDLGAVVYEKIRKPGKGNGRFFVEKILDQRAKYFTPHPSQSPSQLLGDVPLETIARDIGESSSNSRQRKSIYRGISALAGMCVGDIGDLISLYEQILKKASGKTTPIAPEIQSDCFQDFCARRLYDLNRRGGFLKDVAKSFAEGSHELLVKSSRSKSGKKRIRQYSSLYVRITTGHLEKQTERLRELIDAGVFVFAGGSNVPRAKTRDSNPTQQFKLTYRKIYGLVNFIGLAERDRYELSGSDLEEWLNDPSRGKEILLRNLGGDDSEDQVTDEEVKKDHSRGQKHEKQQMPLFESQHSVPVLVQDPTPQIDSTELAFWDTKRPIIKKIDGSFSKVPLNSVVIGLGFEERTLESVRRLCSQASPQNAMAIEYVEPGKGTEIRSILEDSVGSCSYLSYSHIFDGGLPDFDGNVLVDITGLAKPVIFHAVRNELRRKRRVWICHTEAQNYYPLDSDLENVLKAEANRDHHALLEQVQKVLTGEDGPYRSYKLLPHDSDDTRQRVCCLFSSPKHERLLSLLDDRDYDRIEIIAPENDSPRSRVAQLAAEVAARNNANSSVTRIDSNDLFNVLTFITERYKWWYIDRGLNFEFGLTGSKLQAVACAAASAAYKISQCWYLKPNRFDSDRFTRGVGKTRIYEISLQDG